jgi:predicted NUDIX family phosphoesterase
MVIATEAFHRAGLFQGFCADVDCYLPRLLEPALLRFLPRSLAEDDPSYKQIVPYVVFQWRDQVFHYRRGGQTTEARLRARRSIGVGGHISESDVSAANDPYRVGMLREVAEEVFLDTAYRERCIGLINDDATPVGQVHLGIVHVFELEQPLVRRREEGLTAAGFAPLAQLREEKLGFESWSQFLLHTGVL